MSRESHRFFGQTYVHGGALGDVDAVVGLASRNDDGVSSAKEAVLGSQIVLP